MSARRNWLAFVCCDLDWYVTFNEHFFSTFLTPEFFLQPLPVRLHSTTFLKDVFCAAYGTFIITRSNDVFGFGLSNFYQLGGLIIILQVSEIWVVHFPLTNLWCGTVPRPSSWTRTRRVALPTRVRVKPRFWLSVWKITRIVSCHIKWSNCSIFQVYAV